MNDNSSQHENDKVVLTLENVFYQFTPSQAGIGDLFFTPNSMHYVTYFEFPPHDVLIPVGGRRFRRVNPQSYRSGTCSKTAICPVGAEPPRKAEAKRECSHDSTQ